jgi:hypothetical protein
MKSDPEAWQARAHMCARRILSAACFKVSSEVSINETSSLLLPTVGSYYAVFHLGIAALSLDPGTVSDDLKEMGHSRLETLLRTRLVEQKVLESEFLFALTELRKVREYANYVVGGKMASDYAHPVRSGNGATVLSDLVAKAFNPGLAFVRRVSAESASTLEGDIIARIKTTIGDDIGDEVYSMYLSKTHRDRVIDYLVDEDLTT